MNNIGKVVALKNLEGRGLALAMAMHMNNNNNMLLYKYIFVHYLMQLFYIIICTHLVTNNQNIVQYLVA